MDVRDEILIKKLLTNHLFFVRYFFKQITGEKFIVNWHHKELCELADTIFRGESTRDIINAPPRYSKTEIFVVMFIAHGFALNPKSNWIHISAMDRLVMENSEKIRDLVNSEEYQRLFPYVQLKADSKNKGRWKTTEGGGLLAVAAGGQITGFGAGRTQTVDYAGMGVLERMQNFNGAIVMDDTIKPDDADSIKKKDAINYRYDSTVKNRVNNRQTAIINMQQRVDKLDLTGYILQNDTDKWNVHAYKAIIKRNGETIALWEHKHTLEELYKLRRANQTVFDTQYMQDPKPKAGLMFECEKKFDKLSKEPDLKLFIIDPADEGKDLFAGGYFEIMDKKIYMPDVICNKKNKDWNLKDIADCINKNKVNYAFIESNGLGTGFKKDLNKLTSITVAAVSNAKNKHKRIYAESGFINDNFYFKESHDRHSDPSEQLGDYELFMLHLSSYTKTGGYEPDDPPDMLALASRIIRQKFQYLLE
jgi:predicted phage terminase large subunit-like protein